MKYQRLTLRLLMSHVPTALTYCVLQPSVEKTYRWQRLLRISSELAPALIRRIFARWASSPTARQEALETRPSMATTLSRSMSLRAFWTATPGLASSSVMSSSLRLMTPPLAFSSSTASVAPCLPYSPMAPRNPVNGMIWPMRIASCAWTMAGKNRSGLAAAATAPAAAVARKRRRLTLRVEFRPWPIASPPWRRLRSSAPDVVKTKARAAATRDGRIDGMKRRPSRSTWWHMLPDKTRAEASHGPYWHRCSHEGKSNLVSWPRGGAVPSAWHGWRVLCAQATVLRPPGRGPAPMPREQRSLGWSRHLRKRTARLTRRLHRRRAQCHNGGVGRPAAPGYNARR